MNRSIGQNRVNLLSLVVLAFFTIGTWAVWQKISIHWNSDDNSYAYLIIPVFLYLCWEKKDDFKFLEMSWSAWGLVVAPFALGLFFLGEVGSVETLLYVGLWLSLVSIIVTMYGWRTRLLLFPILILVFIVPLPSYINKILTFNLKLMASSLSVAMLRIAGVSVALDGNIIDLGVEQLQVVDACSGLRYFMPMILLSLLIGHFFSPGWWRQFVLLVLVPPIAIIANGVRIFLTGMLVVKGYPELASNLSHDATGLILFLISGVLLFVVSHFLKRIGAPPDTGTYDRGSGDAGLVRPVALSLVLSLLFLGAGWVLKELPSAANLPARSTLLDKFPMEIAGWQGERQYLSPEILNSLWADDYINATFTRPGSPNLIYLLIPFYEYQGTRHTVHAPQSCLLGGGWAIMKSDVRQFRVGPGEEIPVKVLEMGKGDSIMLASHFFLQRGRVITSPWLNKFYLMVDSITRRRTDGALVRVEMLMAPGQDLEEGTRMLEEFVGEMWQVLPEYVPE